MRNEEARIRVNTGKEGNRLGRMPGRKEIQQCPFCDAPWGECVHARLLLEWETDALEREARDGHGAHGASDNTSKREAGSMDFTANLRNSR